MKKILTIALLLAGTSVLAEVNMPSTTPIYFPEVKDQNYTNQNNYKKTNTYKQQIPTKPQNLNINKNISTSNSNPMTSLGKSAAQAILNEDDNAIERILNQMIDKGAEDFDIAEYENGCPYRKYLTPKTIGGNSLIFSETLCSRQYLRFISITPEFIYNEVGEILYFSFK